MTIVRPASIADLPSITEIHNYYVQNTHITFDVQPFSPEQRVPWFKEHTNNGRHRLLVAEDRNGKIAGYTATGSFRSKEAYETAVEVSIACSLESVNKGIGHSCTKLCFRCLHKKMFAALSPELRSLTRPRMRFTSASISKKSGRLPRSDESLANFGTFCGWKKSIHR